MVMDITTAPVTIPAADAMNTELRLRLDAMRAGVRIASTDRLVQVTRKVIVAGGTVAFVPGDYALATPATDGPLRAAFSRTTGAAHAIPARSITDVVRAV